MTIYLTYAGPRAKMSVKSRAAQRSIGRLPTSFFSYPSLVGYHIITPDLWQSKTRAGDGRVRSEGGRMFSDGGRVTNCWHRWAMKNDERWTSTMNEQGSEPLMLNGSVDERRELDWRTRRETMLDLAVERWRTKEQNSGNCIQLSHPWSGRVSSEPKYTHPKPTANIESSGGFHPSRGRAGIHPIFFGRIVGWRKIPVGYPIYCAGLSVCVDKLMSWLSFKIIISKSLENRWLSN